MVAEEERELTTQSPFLHPGPSQPPHLPRPIQPCCCGLWCCVQVEGAPTLVKKGVKKEEAEEIKKKLEAGE